MVEYEGCCYEYCLKTPMVPVVLFEIVSVIHMLTYSIFLEDSGNYTSLDIFLVTFVLLMLIPFHVITYFGAAQRKKGYLAVSGILYLILMLVFVSMYNTLSPFKISEENKRKPIYISSCIVAIIHFGVTKDVN
ncbi:hypothetical protein O3M35_011772 [Rhynocoris fuscipes]|uniref:Uncharacterized protein n=1 Tax=Rhynocoris fuscipes TaxID=488301 RepID=A0AAW1CZP8_9HEMI